MKIEGEKFGESYYEELNQCFDKQLYNNTEQMVEAIMKEFRIKDIHRVLIMLLDDREKLIHDIVTNKGLIVTDIEPFEIVEKFINHVGEKDFNLMINTKDSFDSEFSDFFESITFKL